MPASAAAAGTTSAAPSRRLSLLPREPRRSVPADHGPRRQRPARPERTAAARAERFAYLKRSYD